MIYGYCPAPPGGSSARAAASLAAAGTVRIFQEVESAARPQLAKAIGALRPSDVLLVAKVGGLARSARDLLNIIRDVTGAGAVFRSLAEPFLDTDSGAKDAVIAALTLAAALDRAALLARTRAGRLNSRPPASSPRDPRKKRS